MELKSGVAVGLDTRKKGAGSTVPRPLGEPHQAAGIPRDHPAFSQSLQTVCARGIWLSESVR